MQTFRKIVVGFLSFILYVVLVAGATALTITLVFSKPSSIEQTLSTSKIYDNFVENLLEQAAKNGDSNSNGGIVASDTAVKKAAINAFSPQLLEHSVNDFINANYAWLQGKTAKPIFVIDLSEAKKQFAKEVGDAVTVHLASVPVCTAQQLSLINYEQSDPLTISCRPATITAVAGGAQVEKDLAEGDNLLSQTTFTADTLTKEGSKPYYQQASFAPQVYKVALYSPYVLSGLAIIVMLLILFIAPRRRNGVRAISIVLLISGLMLIGAYGASIFAYNQLHTALLKNNDLGGLRQPVVEIVHHLQLAIAQHYLISGLVLLLLSIIGFTTLLITRKRRRGPDPVAAPTQSQSSHTSPQTSADQQPPIRTAPSAPPLSPHRRPVSSSPPHVRPKRPRLIQ